MPDQKEVDSAVSKIESAAHAKTDHPIADARKAWADDLNAHANQYKNNPTELNAFRTAVYGNLQKVDPALLPELTVQPVKMSGEQATNVLDTVRTLPQDAQNKFFPDGKTISPDGLKGLLQADQQSPFLTVAQRQVVSDLNTNWSKYAGDQKNVGIDQIFMADSQYQDPIDGQKQFLGQLKAEDADVGKMLKGLSDVSAQGATDANGNISKDALSTKLQQDGQQANPMLAALYQNFDYISHDGKTISPNDLSQFAQSHNQTFSGMKDWGKQSDTSTKSSDSSNQSATDGPPSKDALDKAKQAVDALPQELTLGKDGKVLYDLATKTLESRSKLTGETINNDSVMREVNRIMVDNGYPDAHLDGKTHITMADLPAEWNHIRNGQAFKLYSDDEKAQLQQLIAKKMEPPKQTNDQPGSQSGDPNAGNTSSGRGNYSDYGAPNATGSSDNSNRGNGTDQSGAPTDSSSATRRSSAATAPVGGVNYSDFGWFPSPTPSTDSSSTDQSRSSDQTQTAQNDQTDPSIADQSTKG